MADYNIGVAVEGAQRAQADLQSISIAGAAMGAAITAAFYKSVDAFGDFEQGLADLSSITGATGADLANMGTAARDMGLNVTGGATAALKAMEAIGSAKPELLQSTEALVAMTDAANVLAKASGDALPQAASNLTGIMNQFGAGAEQANRYINVLAAGSLAGAANITELAASMQSAGAMAAAFNVPIEETVAVLETLADKSIKGAEAGTALRNILTVMSATGALPAEALEQLEKFGVDLDKVSDKALPFNERLAELSKIGGDATAIVKVFGKENEVAALALLNNTKRAEELTKAVTGTNTAYDQAATRTATFKASMEQLQNAMQDVLIDVGAIVAPVIQLGAELLSNKGALLLVAAAYAAYNGAAIAAAVSTVAMNVATAAQSAYLSASITVQAAYIAITSANATATGIATAAMRLFNVVVASNPLGAAIVLATALGAAFYYLADSTKALTKEEAYHADLSKQVADGFGKESAGAAQLFAQLKTLNPKSAEAKTVRDEINKTYATYLPNQLTEASNNDQIAASQDAVNAALMTKIKLQVREQELTRAYTQQQTALIQANEALTAANVKSTAIQKAVLSVQDALAKTTEDGRLAALQASGDYNTLARELGKVAGVGPDVTATIKAITDAGLGLDFLDAAGAVSITEDSIRSLLAFMDEVPASATNAGASLGNTGTGMGGQAIAATGSIDALNAQLSKLRDEFNATGSEATRLSLAPQIDELEKAIDRATNLTAIIESVSDGFKMPGVADFTNSELDEYLGTVTDATIEATRHAEHLSQVFGSMGPQGVQTLTDLGEAAKSFGDKFREAIGPEATAKFESSIGQMKDLLVDFAASTAEAIGYAIGKGESAADAFKQAIGEFVQQATKMAGMAMLNIAATPGIGPAAIPFLVGGLALLGLSGIIKGVQDSQDERIEAANRASNAPSIGSQAQDGGITGLSVSNSGSLEGKTLYLNVDGRSIEAVISEQQDRRERLKGN